MELRQSPPHAESDHFREALMDQLLDELLEEPDKERKRVIWRAYARLHAMRSSQLVDAMERAKGMHR